MACPNGTISTLPEAIKTSRCLATVTRFILIASEISLKDIP
ncbi:hypothetical protein [Methanolacinia petrolearia]